MTDTPAAAPKGATTYIIGCKLPNGLICELGKVGDDNYRRVDLNGAKTARIVGGYGLTPVAADFWDAWVKKNGRLSFVKTGQVFAEGDMASAEDHSKDWAEKKSGFERLDPYKDVQRLTKGEAEPDLGHLQAGTKALKNIGMA